MRSWILKKMAFTSRHAQKCPICSLGCENCRGKKSEPDFFLLWNCDCEGRFSICAYLQYIYMQICSQVLDRHGAFSLDAVISLGSTGAATLGGVN